MITLERFVALSVQLADTKAQLEITTAQLNEFKGLFAEAQKTIQALTEEIEKAPAE